MMSKGLAKKPKKLRHITLNLFLDDESDEEEQADGSAARSKQVANVESHAINAPSLAGPVLMDEPIREFIRSPSPPSRLHSPVLPTKTSSLPTQTAQLFHSSPLPPPISRILSPQLAQPVYQFL